MDVDGRTDGEVVSKRRKAQLTVTEQVQTLLAQDNTDIIAS